MTPNGCPKGRAICKGHRHFHGGMRDGDTECIDKAEPAEFPRIINSMLIQGQRCWYEIDPAHSHGNSIAYQFIGFGRNGPTHGGPTQTKDQQT